MTLDYSVALDSVLSRSVSNVRDVIDQFAYSGVVSAEVHAWQAYYCNVHSACENFRRAIKRAGYQAHIRPSIHGQKLYLIRK